MNWPRPSNGEVAVQAPALSSLVPYLIASGWIQIDEDERTSLWGSDQLKDDLRIVLPARRNVSDYDDRVYDALRILSYVERRTLSEVASDIVFGPADTVAVRLTPGTPSGSRGAA